MELGIFDKYRTTLGLNDHVERVLSSNKPTAINFEIDLTNACNHRCSFCQWGDYIQGSRATLDSKIVSRTLPELKKYGTKAITWTGGGEPTVHREYFNLLNESYLLGMDNGLLTNGSLLDKKYDKQILTQLKFLRISMAGGNRKDYKKVQGRDDFDLVMNNLGRINSLKKKMKSKTTTGVAFLANKNNATSLENLIDKLLISNCDYLQVRRDNYITADEKNWWNENIGKKCDRLAKETKKKGLEILSEGYVSYQSFINYPKKCYAHYFVMAINAEGNVMFCKNTRDNPKFYIGNLNEETFSNIWIKSKINKELENNINPANCATFCKNMQINKAMEDVSKGEVLMSDYKNIIVKHKNFP